MRHLAVTERLHPRRAHEVVHFMGMEEEEDLPCEGEVFLLLNDGRRRKAVLIRIEHLVLEDMPWKLTFHLVLEDTWD